MSQAPHYIDGEKVLCYHGPLLYEAKCLKSEIKDKTIKYFIHYSGWNKNWDEWVPECRVLKYIDVNLAKQKELADTHTKKSKKSKSSKSTSKKASEKEKETTAPVVEKPIKQPKVEKRVAIAPVECASKQPEPKRAKPLETKKAKVSEPKKAKVPEPKKAKVPEPKKAKVPEAKKAKVPEPRKAKTPEPKKVKTPEPKKVVPPVERQLEDEPKPPVEIKLCIPVNLRNWLVDDDDLVNHKNKLLRLPARITVDHIIASYVKEKVSVKGLEHKTEVFIIQVANRIRDAFNVLLGIRLLYKFERPQYAEMLAEYPNLKMCEIYGAPHLLRMFTKLGKMLTPIAEKGSNLDALVGQINDFIWYLGTNPNFFSLDDFVVATPEYYRRALT